MASEEILSNNPWARFLGIDAIEYLENVDASIKPKNTVTKLNYEDMALFGLCPVYEDLHLTFCKICESILIPQAFKAHMELRHGAKVKEEKQDEKVSSQSLHAKHRTIPPVSSSSASVVGSSVSAACSSASAATASASPECSGAYAACGSASVGSPDSPGVGSRAFMALTQPASEAKPSWLSGVNTIHGATQQQSFPNTNASANIVRVKSENTKLKILTAPYNKVDSSMNSLIKNIPAKKTVSHKKELLSSQQSQPILPELFSNFPTPPNASPSTSSKLLPGKFNATLPSESKTEGNSVYTSDLKPCQSSSTSSSESSSTADNSEASQTGEKAPALEKLVLRRVLQTGPNTSAVRRPTFQKGMKGLARNKNSSQETYFMVVKQKDRQQNLLAARQQLRKQSNVVHKEKDKVEQKLNHLESVRDKLISQLFQELQAVKQKLHQCNVSKSELHKELMAVSAQLEEARRTTKFQTETLSKQNSEYKKEIQDLKEKIDVLTASTSNFLEQQQMANQACKVRQYANVISELKRRLDLQITQNEELRTQKDMLEKHLSPEIRFQVKSQIANFQVQQEIYPGLNITESSIPSPAVPFAEKYLTDLRNIEYCAFQHQMAND